MQLRLLPYIHATASRVALLAYTYAIVQVIADLKTQLENRKQACTKLKTENQRLEKVSLPLPRLCMDPTRQIRPSRSIGTPASSASLCSSRAAVHHQDKKSLEKELLNYQIGKGSTSTLGSSSAQRALQRAVKDQQRALNATNMQAAKAAQESGDLHHRLLLWSIEHCIPARGHHQSCNWSIIHLPLTEVDPHVYLQRRYMRALVPIPLGMCMAVQRRLEQMTEQCQTLEADIEAFRQERDKAREVSRPLSRPGPYDPWPSFTCTWLRPLVC